MTKRKQLKRRSTTNKPTLPVLPAPAAPLAPLISGESNGLTGVHPGALQIPDDWPSPTVLIDPVDVKPPADPPQSGMAWVPGGTFTMGANEFYPEEAPAHEAAVDGFWMDRYTVTNEQFMRFVNETRFRTYAEKAPKAEDYPGVDPAALVAGSLVFVKPPGRVDLNNYANWWHFVPGADWRHPLGPGSSIRKLRKHPVVHINYGDALAYAEWAGKELPTEAQWEFAARSGLEGAIYPWGNQLCIDDKMMANTWQGEFPWQNLTEDGYESTAPVGAFPPNIYGLYELAGNVWEWTSDWFSSNHPIDTTKSCCTPQNPRGANMNDSYDPSMPHIQIPRKVIKGGSYLCAPNYCLRYRPAARSPEMIDSATNHLGFRCVVNV